MSTKDYQPLAESLRPQGLADFVGQAHLLAPGRALRESVEAGRLHSMILWGPPGTGKTTLIKMLAGLFKPDDDDVEMPQLSISYKPQTIAPKF